eukprot:TRINITY_DN1765_c0_g1_i1.p1 TRINITY_DN1765_c0_g1~~TRINITY_DN1765_c0_g1_i1.p1  ORF type:complete len:378 (-),score=64.91 TRINITY_DN1765_c0_g1_i1:55-1188(-)
MVPEIIHPSPRGGLFLISSVGSCRPFISNKFVICFFKPHQMNTLVAVLGLFVFSALAQGPSAIGGCDFTGALSATTYNTLLSNVAAKTFSADKAQVIADFANSNNTDGLTSDQVVGILTQFTYVSDRQDVLQLLNKFVLTLSVDGVISIIRSGAYSSEKVDALAQLVNLTSVQDLRANSSKIIAEYQYSSDKKEAQKIIDAAVPRSCLFGAVTLTRFAFIIDDSGSMDYKLTDSDGTVLTRLQYVQRDLLHIINGTLTSIQEFNIIRFSENAGAWQPGVVAANYTNVVSASLYVKKLTAGGGTYMFKALQLAFSDPKVQGVYFLSDGEPSDSASSVYNYAASVGKPINTISFKAGASAASFMQSLASVSHGTFRAVQ